MINLTIDDQVAERLQGIADRENISVSEVLRLLLDIHQEPITYQKTLPEALKAMAGMFDDDITDLSTHAFSEIKRPIFS